MSDDLARLRAENERLRAARDRVLTLCGPRDHADGWSIDARTVIALLSTHADEKGTS